MLRSSIVRLVELCTRHAWPVIVLAVALAAFCSFYTARHFAVATDIKQLFPAELPWAQRAYDLIGAFPQHDVLVVVDAPTPESADQAAAKLTAALSADTAHFKTVQQPQGGAFFAHSGLLFLPTGELQRMAGDLSMPAAERLCPVSVMGIRWSPEPLLARLTRSPTLTPVSLRTSRPRRWPTVWPPRLRRG